MIVRPRTLHSQRQRIQAAALATFATLAGAASPPAFGSATAQDFVTAGWRAYRAGMMPEAHRAFLAAAEASPSWATPAVWLAAVLVARGDRTDAAVWFRAALGRRPTMAQATFASEWLARLGVSMSPPGWVAPTVDPLAGFVHTANPRLTAEEARWVAGALRAAASDEDVEVQLLASVVYVESRFNHQSISSAGAIGLGQLMPDTAAGLGVDARDPWQNVAGAARLLREDIDEFHSVPLGLAAYNAGSGAVRRWHAIPPYPETRWYVWAVLWIRDWLAARLNVSSDRRGGAAGATVHLANATAAARRS